jgi:hypothetical protein
VQRERFCSWAACAALRRSRWLLFVWAAAVH